jgi:hypothetical protein
MQGVLLGMSNTAGVLAGVLGTAATGYILQNGRFPCLVCFFFHIVKFTNMTAFFKIKIKLTNILLPFTMLKDWVIN